MSDDFDLETLFEGLPNDKAQEVARTMLEAGRQRAQALRIPEDVIAEVRGKQPEQPRADDLDAQEAAERDELKKSGVRGHSYALQARNIGQKYARLRAEAARQPEADPEIEKLKDDPKALRQLYLSRIATIQRGDPLALRKKSQIASAFRAKGLNV